MLKKIEELKMKIAWLFISMIFFMHAKDYTTHPETKRCISILVGKYHFERGELEKLFSNVKVQKTALRPFLSKRQQRKIKVKDTRSKAQIARAKRIIKKYGRWERYARLKLNHARVRQGARFIRRHEDTFKAVEKKYGVPKEYIAAIIGIETVYGRNVGKHPVFDTLCTLAFEKNRRNKFFQKQLIKFMHLSKREKFNPKNVRGSYAGAIGLGQFMPSNYEAYGVDFNGDGKITLQRAEDAIASVANYFKKNGWRRGEPVATQVSYKGNRFNQLETGYKKTYNRADLIGINPIQSWDYKGRVRLIKLHKKRYDELWYGAKNFFVITRYNHSAYYAMAVHQLALKIRKELHEN